MFDADNTAYKITNPDSFGRDMARSWSYKPDDPVKSRDELILMLVNTMGHGGDLLLNVGPGPDDRIPDAQAERMREIGAWLNEYGEAIYATRPGPWKPGPWGVNVRKQRTAYLHVHTWEEEDTLRLPALEGSRIARAAILGGPEIAFQEEYGRATFVVESEIQSSPVTVVRPTLDTPARSRFASLHPKNVPWSDPHGTIATPAINPRVNNNVGTPESITTTPQPRGRTIQSHQSCW